MLGIYIYIFLNLFIIFPIFSHPEVLKVMEAKTATLPQPFPQSAQYKSSMDDVDDDGELDKPNLSQKPTQKKRKKKNAKKVRRAQLKHAAQQYIDKKRLGGMSWKDANAEWNTSDLKRRLLSCVDLSELKRRRFVPKECEANPWAS